eukprot:TRINITY_DN413_c0_g3_i7.p1 TRINITY_DN413_c0_g3~~TRINITY_DN413_c0_g3_i7.p1  ORF type:complete len:366 (-),score=75.76 TRINITY_DN413_c0_g3_i7:46-1092(-)
MGGLHSSQSGTVYVDQLGLVEGNTYPMDFFFAERHYDASSLTFTTSLVLFDYNPAPCFTSQPTFGAIIRDFANIDSGLPQKHPDFNSNSINCGSGKNMVASTIGCDLKPTYYPNTCTTSLTSFNQWFRDVPNVNKAVSYVLTTKFDPATNTYTYNPDLNFFPIDGQLFGNEGNRNNFGFTLEAHASFIFRKGLTITMLSDDDSWLYINYKLAIDLGGLHGPTSLTLNLNTLPLVEGDIYTLDVFFAERHTGGSQFSLTTNFPLISTTPVIASSQIPIIMTKVSADTADSTTTQSTSSILSSLPIWVLPTVVVMGVVIVVLLILLVVVKVRSSGINAEYFFFFFFFFFF